MATVYPFRALRPRQADAAQIASVPYDVVNSTEARQLAGGNPLSFLRVSRAEIELPPGTDPYSPEVYDRAVANFAELRNKALVVETSPSVYVYRLRMGSHEQTGIAAAFSIPEYDRGVIKKHERTRPDKEDDRTRHMVALAAQTGPVLLTYRTNPEISAVTTRVTSEQPLFDFEAADGVRHTLWRASPADADRIVSSFAKVPALYIADGHHRAASAARARDEMRSLKASSSNGAGEPEYERVLAVAFPSDSVQILPYNRIVKDLGRLSREQFLSAVGERFTMEPGPSTPREKGSVSMYFDGSWRRLRPKAAVDATDPIGSLDVSVLQDRLLAPVLGIADVRSDKRIDFVGGIRGAKELEQLVDSGQAAVAFSMFPVTVDDLMAVSDADEIMPPKSTWFEPKLRDGLLIHEI